MKSNVACDSIYTRYPLGVLNDEVRHCHQQRRCMRRQFMISVINASSIKANSIVKSWISIAHPIRTHEIPKVVIGWQEGKGEG